MVTSSSRRPLQSSSYTTSWDANAARLGLRTALISVVGDDAAGRLILDELTSRHVDVSACRIAEDVATGMTLNLLKGGDRAMLTFPGAMSTTSAQLVPLKRLENCRHLHASSIFLQPRLALEVVDLLSAAHRFGATTSVDTGWDPSGLWGCDFWGLLPHVDVLLPNAREALAIARAMDKTAAPLDLTTAMNLLSRTGTLPVIKCGTAGSAMLLHGQVLRARALASEVVDAVGAGDSFDAGFLVGWLSSLSGAESLALATAVGTLSTRAAGGTAGQPTIDEAMAAARLINETVPLGTRIASTPQSSE